MRLLRTIECSRGAGALTSQKSCPPRARKLQAEYRLTQDAAPGELYGQDLGKQNPSKPARTITAVNVPLTIPAIEKLVDHVASGIGSVAGPMLAPWIARREAHAREIAAVGEAQALLIQATAQAEARQILLSRDEPVSGTLEIADRVRQRIQFQEEKRQENIESVVSQAAEQLGDKKVADEEPDHDWTARFFNHVQDVSSKEMQTLWARVLSGEVERKGSTSVRTLEILRNLDQATAELFRRLCSACVFVVIGSDVLDARVPSLGGNAATNSLKAHGLDFGVLNRLNEHGLIISDYNSWFDFQAAIGVTVGDRTAVMPFVFQGKPWILAPEESRELGQTYRLSGVALSISGRELARIVEIEPIEAFTEDLKGYFLRDKLQMVELPQAPDRAST